MLFQFQSKTIKKLIIKGLKDYENHNEEDCMLIFLEKLKALWKYNTEIYACHLGVSLGNIIGQILSDSVIYWPFYQMWVYMILR